MGAAVGSLQYIYDISRFIIWNQLQADCSATVLHDEYLVSAFYPSGIPANPSCILEDAQLWIATCEFCWPVLTARTLKNDCLQPAPACHILSEN